jgi:hypothetical protein
MAGNLDFESADEPDGLGVSNDRFVVFSVLKEGVSPATTKK